MNTLSSCLLAYAVNSLWQVPLLVLSATWIGHLAKRCTAETRHRLWVGALALEMILPAAFLLPSHSFLSLLHWFPWFLTPEHAAANGRVTVVVGAVHAHGALSLPAPLLLLAVGAYLGSVLFFCAQLLWAARQTRSLRLRSRRVDLAEPALENWRRYMSLFGVGEAELRSCDNICGPVTVGVRRRVLLVPEDFTGALLGEDQDAALAHEFAHMRRRDFGLNLLYRLLSLPVAYHPFLHLTLARIAETREMVCDALAAEKVAGPERYAKSLLRLAAAYLPGETATSIHAIGIFDANTLERRIMTLRTKHTGLRFVERVAIVAASVAVVLGTATSAMGLSMSVATPAAQTPAAGNVARVSGGVMAGNVLTKVNPVYPQAARDAGITGAVVLSARIGKDGTIEALKVISGPTELAGAALEAVRQWTYQPYQLNGAPVEVDTTITVNFQLAK